MNILIGRVKENKRGSLFRLPQTVDKLTGSRIRSFKERDPKG